MMAFAQDLRLSLPLVVFATAWVMVLILVSIYTDQDLSPGLILTVAAIIRIMVLFRAPELSDDIFRYLWDGLQTVSGHNPYQLAPAQVVSGSQAARTLLPLVNHPGLITVYPPGAQVVFFAAALIGPWPIVLKTLLVLMDLATCALIIQWLRQLGQPVTRSLIYAWHPLAVLEIAGSGHIDGAGIFFLFLSLTLAQTIWNSKIRPLCLGLSGGLFAWSCLVKLFPLVFFPLFFFSLHKRQRILFLAGAVSGTLLLCHPFLPDLPHMFGTLGTYTRHWEFSGFSFFWLRQWGLSGDLSRVILGSAFVLALTGIVCRYALGPGDFTHRVFYPFYLINLAFLFLTPTLHPWYALYMTAMLPFVPGMAGVILSWSVFLAYSVQIPYVLTGAWTEDPLSINLIWAGPLGACFAGYLVKAFGKSSTV